MYVALYTVTYNKDDKACGWVVVGLTKAELSTGCAKYVHKSYSYSLIEEDDSIGENRSDKELQMGEAKFAALPVEAYGTTSVELVLHMSRV